MKKLKILFLTKTKNLNIGSYRLWVNNLSKKLNLMGHQSLIKYKIPKKSIFDIIFFGKAFNHDEIDKIKKTINNKKTLIASINPPIDSRYKVDFVLTGSIEESCSLSYKNSFIYPLIEKDNLLKKKKYLSIKKKIIILIHGNHTHLKSLFNYGFEDSLKKYISYLKIKNLQYEIIFFLDVLPIYYKKKLDKLKFNYKYIKYKHTEVRKIFSLSDIAIVVSSAIEVNTKKNLLDNIIGNKKIYFENINLKFKNKSNFGRALLAMQNGLSVIADITPSNLSLYNYFNENMLFFIDKNQLFENLKKLTDHKYRKKISINAYKSVKLYNSNQNKFAFKLLNYINDLKLDNEKNTKKIL